MTATVVHLPGAGVAAPERQPLNLTTEEVIEASGGYVRPADQLRALHARGFSRAWRRPGGPVILERGHHEAVINGKYGQQSELASATQAPALQPKPNSAALRQRFKGRG